MRPLTIKEALLRMKKGVLSAEELCHQCQNVLSKTRQLNMYVSETEAALVHKKAQAASKAYATGSPRPLEGIPVSFKDNFCTEGVATTCGSRMLLNYVPPYNATMVSKMQGRGAISFGKTNLDEFAMGSGSLDGCHGPVKSPWNLVTELSQGSLEQNVDSSVHKSTLESTKENTTLPSPDDFYIAGGSSGGSAAAVASGSCLVGFGSDTGGSTRIPASYCGIVGLKPTYGLLSRHGLIPLVNSMDVPGIMTQTAEDAAFVLNAVAGHDPKDSTTVTENHKPFVIDYDMDLSKLHIGVPLEYHSPGMSQEILQLWQDTADTLERAGAKVSQVSMPHSQYCILCYHVLCCCEVASNFSRYDGIEFGLRDGCEESTEQLYAESRHKGFNDVVRGRILAGNFFLLKRNYDKFFLKAQRVRRLISNDFRSVFNDKGIDFLLTPITLSDAPLQSWFSAKDNRTRCEELDVLSTPANMAGVPGVSVPLKLSARGLPLGLQLLGPHFSESRLLSLAHWLETQAQFPHLDLDINALSAEKVAC